MAHSDVSQEAEWGRGQAWHTLELCCLTLTGGQTAAAWALVHACHGAGGGSEGTRLLLAGQVRTQEGRQATRARGAQAWAVLDTLECRQGCICVQNAQGMGAQKRGAARPPDGGQARPAGWVFAGEAPQGVAAKHCVFEWASALRVVCRVLNTRLECFRETVNTNSNRE